MSFVNKADIKSKHDYKFMNKWNLKVFFIMKKIGYWSFVMGIKLFSLIDKRVNNQVVRATVFNISVANKQVVKHMV